MNSQKCDIIYDSDLTKEIKVHSTTIDAPFKSFFILKNKIINCKYNSCSNICFHYNEFKLIYQNKDICRDCAKLIDPQIINILQFIITGTTKQNRLKKFKIGIDNLRKTIAENDPYAKKCFICTEKKVYYKLSGEECFSCGFKNLGACRFELEGKNFSFQEAKRILKIRSLL